MLITDFRYTTITIATLATQHTRCSKQPGHL